MTATFRPLLFAVFCFWSTRPLAAPVLEPVQFERLLIKPLYTRAQLTALARSVGFQGLEAETMAGIALRESRGFPGAVNRNRATRDESYGLWQINLRGRLRSRMALVGAKRAEELLEPLMNARLAFALWKQAGIKPWERRR